MASTKGILNKIFEEARSAQKRLLAILIDPDKFSSTDVGSIRTWSENGADLFLVGGSLIMSDALFETVAMIKNVTDKPVYLFPSSPTHITSNADGILFLSLLSGRNPDLLIGKHVESAPILAKTHLHVLSTGYMLIDSGSFTTAHYMSQSNPIPFDKPEIAEATAIAGEYLGMQCIYLDGGSGAQKPISPAMISAVRRSSDLPLIIGGGIRDGASARKACEAGADMIVVGTALENDPAILQDISIAVHTSKISS